MLEQIKFYGDSLPHTISRRFQATACYLLWQFFRPFLAIIISCLEIIVIYCCYIFTLTSFRIEGNYCIASCHRWTHSLERKQNKRTNNNGKTINRSHYISGATKQQHYYYEMYSRFISSNSAGDCCGKRVGTKKHASRRSCNESNHKRTMQLNHFCLLFLSLSLYIVLGFSRYSIS